MSENVASKTLDLRIKRSRKHLIEALFELMHEQPFQKITVQNITERAMVNRSTFYAHFVDKFDLFSTAIGLRIRQDLASGLAGSTGFTPANLRMLIITTGNLTTALSGECGPTPTDGLLPLIMTEMQNAIYDIMLTWTNALGTTSDAAHQSETLAMFMAGTIIGTVTLWKQHAYPDTTVEQLADQMLPLLMDGVGRFSG